MAAALQKKESGVQRCCGHCVHFCNAPAAVEAAFPGLAVMSSGSASVRSHDGLCGKHDVYLSFRDCCGDFSSVHDAKIL